MNSNPKFRSVSTRRFGTITLNRPNLGNALTRAMMIRLANHIRTLSARADVHVLVLTANGRRILPRPGRRYRKSQAMSAYRLRENLMSGLLGVFEAIRTGTDSPSWRASRVLRAISV